ncbi:hypothetical protein JOC75_002253 [Metabacillus crassostreae]|uniref:hypothetical protein n=1 Tax=Metabacillus crassostreae TaxID=929098 RepID=UPI001EF98F71|nr:hypothetical protein [Metabacillus crassostreae]MBM7604280.1 hypothetical protein [Metabacillus crassostreae]
MVLRLPASDLGLMAEHLAAHEGIINKLKRDYLVIQNPALKQVLYTSITIMRDHVRVMLALIDPQQHSPVHLAQIPINQEKFVYHNLSEQEKHIALEARSTSMSMASNNFTSALRMKDANTKYVHFKMADQQVKLQGLYNNIVQKTNSDYTPKATEKEQLKTLQHYLHILNE